MNYTRFEELTGIPLGMFVSDVIKRAHIDDAILAYCRQHRTSLDSQHLEMIVLLLEKVGTPAALNEVASFLDHPAKSVRYQAAQVITNAATLDENAMAKVVNMLSNPPYPEDFIQIKDALYRGCTETAKTIAARFIEMNNLQK